MAESSISLSRPQVLAILNPKRVGRGMHLPTQFQAVEFVKALFLPFVSLYQVLSAAYPKSKNMNMLTSAFYGLFFITWAALSAAYGKYHDVLWCHNVGIDQERFPRALQPSQQHLASSGHRC
jgi:hypothetical protein